MNFLNILFIAGIIIFLIVFYGVERLVVKKGKRFFCFIGSLWRSIKTAILENKDVKNFIGKHPRRSEEHTSELQSHSFISYAVFCLKKKT